ncbi:trypsin-like serine peptidase [Labilithrix luteola]|uniref:trypsin-like serine peptidase n=1 Tax=Labilithrix luteola TaxID=1391654 RepID=UPI0011BA8FBE|nr:hypothetical protein [Labilithrix luteola]
MRKSIWILSSLTAGALGSVACGSDVAGTEDVRVASSAESQRFLAAQPSFVDEVGRRWTKRRDVVYKDVSLADLKEVEERQDSLDPIKDVADMSLDEALKLLAPVREFGGAEFVLDDADATEFVLSIQAVAKEQRESDRIGLSGAPSAGPSKADKRPGDESIGTSKQSLVIGPYDDRFNMSSNANTFPYNLHGWGGTTADPWCTCVKMINNHTCVTSAHCQFDGTSWLMRRQITFQASSSTPLPPVDASCYTRTYAAGWNSSRIRNFDFAVIAFHNSTSFCSLPSYNVGNFGWNTVGNGESNIPVWVSGYPFNDRPPGWSYPALAWATCSGNQPTSNSALLNHVCDTTGGQSGTGVIKNFSSNDVRILGVHSGGGVGGTYNEAVRMTSALAAWATSVGGS